MRIRDGQERYNTSSAKPMPAPDIKKSKQRVIANKDNGPHINFGRVTENQAKRIDYDKSPE